MSVAVAQKALLNREIGTGGCWSHRREPHAEQRWDECLAATASVPHSIIKAPQQDNQDEDEAHAVLAQIEVPFNSTL
jgi:hypothetical protein